MFIRTNAHMTTDVANNTIQAVEMLLRDKGVSEQLIIDQQAKYKAQSNVDKIARALGMAMRHNIPMTQIVQVLQAYHDGMSTLLFHIRKLLSSFIKDGTQVVLNNEKQECPSCNIGTLVYSEGCKMCKDCG